MRLLLAGLLLPFAVGSPTVTAKIDGLDKPCGSAVVGKYLYVDSYGSGVLHRIDPATNRAVRRSRSAAARAASSPARVRSGRRTTTRTPFSASTRRR